MSVLPPLVMTRLATVALGPAPASRLMLNGVVLLQFTLIDEVDACAPWLGSKAVKVNAPAELMTQMALTVVDTPKEELVDAADATAAAEQSTAARAVLSANAFMLKLLERYVSVPGRSCTRKAGNPTGNRMCTGSRWLSSSHVGYRISTCPQDARVPPRAVRSWRQSTWWMRSERRATACGAGECARAPRGCGTKPSRAFVLAMVLT
uniref:Uncharacterized protein n=1 Tax=Ralstonia solanacearum TaxID=305 RepID=A0A0S4WWS1_RALSL|nr:protein of unknown function [Ralstonia solanacearum]